MRVYYTDNPVNEWKIEANTRSWWAQRARKRARERHNLFWFYFSLDDKVEPIFQQANRFVYLRKTKTNANKFRFLSENRYKSFYLFVTQLWWKTREKWCHAEGLRVCWEGRTTSRIVRPSLDAMRSHPISLRSEECDTSDARKYALVGVSAYLPFTE